MEAFDGRDFGPLGCVDGELTRPDRLAVQEHRTGTTLADSTTEFGAGEPERFAQNPEQGVRSSGGVEEGGTININEDDATVTLTIDFDANNTGKLKIKSKNNRDALFNMDAGTVNIDGLQGIEMDGDEDAGSSVAILDMSGGILANDGITSFKKGESDSTKIIITGGTMTLSGDVADNPGVASKCWKMER